MDLEDRLIELQKRLQSQREYITTEEATKTAFVMPFLSALGYDVFDPLEVVPEFTADVGTKKGEKVDYALCNDGRILMLVEVKQIGFPLTDAHIGQLYRYFSVTDARFGLLTNGQIYRFFTDLDAPNVMDSSPFFEFDLAEFKDSDIKELKKFRKQTFSVDGILETAAILKYSNAVKSILEQELEKPSDEFVRFFASRIHNGRLTQNVMNQFRDIVREARLQFINERLNERLQSALEASESKGPDEQAPVEPDSDTPPEADRPGVVTTEEEIEGFQIVRAICREVVDVSRVVMRDTKSYCGILLDDNNRKPICRLHFNAEKAKYVGVFSDKKEERVMINRLDDIFDLADRLKATILEYETPQKA